MATPGARPDKRKRAAARRERRAPAPPPRAPRTPIKYPLPAAPRPLTLLWVAATAVLIWLVASGIGQKITWYLAVDQYGYLAFAHDLVKGHVFHHWPPLDALASQLLPHVDVLSQTYVYDHGRLYCRYAPGFPILLAGWLVLFGDDGAHWLNPTIYLTLLVLLLFFQRRLFRSRWRATAGVALVVLCPSMLHFWGITLTRDLCAHLFGLFGVFLLLPNGRRLDARRMLAAGLALGYTGSIRPDCVLYVIPAGLVVLARFARERQLWRPAVSPVAVAALGMVVGLMPFFTYNWIATGNPLRATQGMELQNFLPGAEETTPAATTNPPARIGYPPGAWQGGTLEAVQGGGLKVTNLSRVLPGNFTLLRGAYGDFFLGIAVLGGILAFFQRRVLFCATVPYCVVALLFYSCWTRPDGRYLSGIYCLIPILIVEGLFGPLDLVRRLVRRGRLEDGRRLSAAFAVSLVLGAVLVAAPRQTTSALPVLVWLLPLGIAAAAGAGALWPQRRVSGVAAPVLAVALVALMAWRASAAGQMRAAFQQPQMLRARQTLARALEPNSVVITTEDIGRPGENIDYYSGVAHAFYLTDLMRWRITVMSAAAMLNDAGMVPYLLLPPTQLGLPGLLTILRANYDTTLIAKIPGRQAMDYFVAAPFHRGIDLELYRLKRKSSAKS